MAWKVCIRALAEKQGIDTIYKLQKFLDLPFYSSAKSMWNSDKWTRIDLGTLELVCEKFDCAAGDVIKDVPEKKKK